MDIRSQTARPTAQASAPLQPLSYAKSPAAPMAWVEHAVCASLGGYCVLLLLSVAGQV